MTARTISTSNGAPPSRTIDSVTAVSFAPRTRSRAASTVRPSSRSPSMASMMSPATSPAASAGEPGIGATTTRRQSAASVVQVEVAPAASTVPIVAPIPSNSPEIERRLSLNSSLVRYSEYGSSSAPIIPLIAPSIERLAIDVAAGVALGDRPVRVPERLERVDLVRGRARGQRGLAPQRPARDEQRASGEDRDDRDGDEERARPPTWRAVRRRAQASATGSGASGVASASIGSGASGRSGPASVVIE